MRYGIGETVVHPHHGLVKVQGLVTREGADGPATYVELRSEANGMVIMVPEASLDEIGIRPPATTEEAETLLALLLEPSEVPMQWSERSAATVSRIRSAELDQAMMVIRDLSLHSARIDKPLTAAEKASLDGCLDTVSTELAIPLNMTPESVRELILSRLHIDADSTA